MGNKKTLSDDDLPHQLCRYLLEAENKQQWAGGQTGCPVGWLDGFQFESQDVSKQDAALTHSSPAGCSARAEGHEDNLQSGG